MESIKTIAHNTLFLTVGQIITIISTYLYTIYSARYLGAEGFGILSFAIAFTGVSCLIVDLGMNVLATREVSRNNLLAGKYIGNMIFVKIILSIFTLALTVIVINYLKYPSNVVQVVYLITLSTIFTSFSSTFTSIFQAFQKMKYISIGKIMSNVFMLTGTLIAINKNLDLLFFGLIYCIVSLFLLVYSFYACSTNFLTPKIEFDLKFCKRLLKESMPFWMTSVFTFIYFRIDIIMISMMKGNVEVGWYAAPYRLIDGLAVIPALFMTVMFPVFSKCYVSSKKLLDLAFRKSFKYLIIIAIPIGIGTTILASDLIAVFYGTEYEPSVSALKILIWASVLSFINWTPATMLNSTNEQRGLMVITCIGAFFNLILNYLLIPSLSYNGAGLATVITELIVGFMILYHIQKKQKIIGLFLDSIIRSLIAAAVMAAFILYFNGNNILFVIIASSILYFICLFIIKAFGKEDLDLLNQIKK